METMRSNLTGQEMTNTILVGDVRDVLPTLPDKSVQMCVTSPPYWGLRDYGTATWEGGDAECDHMELRQPQSLAKLADKMAPRKNPRNPTRQDDEKINARSYRNLCGKCGARRIDSQLGLESTPEEYVTNMTAVFREVRRVLCDDGVLWLNLGDSYFGGGYANHALNGDAWLAEHGGDRRRSRQQDRIRDNPGIKPKDLVGMPWRLAFALQADGWWLRQDIIWSKPNSMPESVTDRCTKAHEYLFLLSKAPKYYYNADAIKIAGSGKSSGNTQHKYVGTGNTLHRTKEGLLAEHKKVRERVNRRSVWTITTQSFKEAHFATFPQSLVEPCVLAGSRQRDVVMDPFMGAGTVACVCERLNRRWIGIELSQEYSDMAYRRIASQTETKQR